MIQEVRIYKQFDTDLVALCAAGYPVGDMIREAVIKFANGIPLTYDIPPAKYFDMNGKRTVRMRISISDKKAVHVLKNIKHGYRNSFCKCLLRNALPNLDPVIFFADEAMFDEYQRPATGSVPEQNRHVMPVVPEVAPLQPFPNVVVPDLHSPAIRPVPQEVIKESGIAVPVPVQDSTASIVQAVPAAVVSSEPEQLPVSESSVSDEESDEILSIFDGL